MLVCLFGLRVRRNQALVWFDAVPAIFLGVCRRLEGGVGQLSRFVVFNGLSGHDDTLPEVSRSIPCSGIDEDRAGRFACLARFFGSTHLDGEAVESTCGIARGDPAGGGDGLPRQRSGSAGALNIFDRHPLARSGGLFRGIRVFWISRVVLGGVPARELRSRSADGEVNGVVVRIGAHCVSSSARGVAEPGTRSGFIHCGGAVPNDVYRVASLSPLTCGI